MSKSCIKLGEWNGPYKYLILIILISILKDIALGSDNYAIISYFKLLDGGNISNCFLVRQTFCYLFTIIVAYIFYKVESNYLGKNEKKLNSTQIPINSFASKPSGSAELIYEEKEMINYSATKLLLIIFIWVLEEQLLIIFKDIFLGLDFWMLELIIIHFFMSKILKMKVYKHQQLMLWFSIVPFSLKLTSIIFSYIDKNNQSNGNDNYKYSNDIDKLKILYVAKNWLAAILFPLYVILIILRSYVVTKIKWLIDLKCISASKIFIIYGIMGFSFTFIICIITTFIPCTSFDDKGDYTIYDYFCGVKYKNKKYIDNFVAYFSGLNERDDNAIIEIIALIFGAICFFLYKFLSLRIIEHLTPVHLIFSFPIFYIFNKIYLLLLNYFKSSPNVWFLNIEYATEKLLLDFCSDIISIIGYLIYLEIIELHCCKYDYNIRRNILDRGLQEIERVSSNNSSFKTESISEVGNLSISSTDIQKSLVEKDNEDNN